MARSLKFRIKEEEELYYPSSENKGAGQLRSYCEADLRLCFRLGKIGFSHDMAHFIVSVSPWAKSKGSAVFPRSSLKSLSRVLDPKKSPAMDLILWLCSSIVLFMFYTFIVN